MQVKVGMASVTVDERVTDGYIATLVDEDGNVVEHADETAAKAVGGLYAVLQDQGITGDSLDAVRVAYLRVRGKASERISGMVRELCEVG